MTFAVNEAVILARKVNLALQSTPYRNLSVWAFTESSGLKPVRAEEVYIVIYSDELPRNKTIGDAKAETIDAIQGIFEGYSPKFIRAPTSGTIPPVNTQEYKQCIIG